MLVAVLFLAGCSDSWLDRQYDGASISQEKYDALGTSKLEGSVRGIYTMIYTMSSDNHDEFGQRSIDLWTDILSGDIAVTDRKYGWLYTDEQMLTYSRTATIWSFYYKMLHNINAVVATIENSSNISSTIASAGYPNPDCTHKYTSDETLYALYLAQVLAVRGYCYANLVRIYTPIEGCQYLSGKNITNYPCIPVYTESNMDNPQALSTSEKVYAQVFGDLEKSISLFDKFGAYYRDSINGGADFTRASKLTMDINVARGLLAYAYLNAAPYYANIDVATQARYNRLAHKYARDVINSGAYTVIPQEKLYSTGFNNVDESSWMWGQDVVTETAGGLKSWFGQVDIHSYSYAWAGDKKVIDDNLANEIPDWDGRAKWFNSSSAWKGCPDGKFFSAKCPTSTKEDDIDREWLSDNVLMRIESMYLIAAEACCAIDSLTASVDYLTAVTDQRMNYDYPDYADDYAQWKNSLTNQSALWAALEYNWRVEMWGEGYGLQTFRRIFSHLGKENRVRGGSHDATGGSKTQPTDVYFNFSIPTSEATYNPNI